MEINKFISKVLDELQDLKSSNNNKKRYEVKELEFDLGVVINSDGNGKISVSTDLFGVSVSGGLGADISKEQTQRVKKKLSPKNEPRIIRTIDKK